MLFYRREKNSDSKRSSPLLPKVANLTPGCVLWLTIHTEIVCQCAPLRDRVSYLTAQRGEPSLFNTAATITPPISKMWHKHTLRKGPREEPNAIPLGARAAVPNPGQRGAQHRSPQSSPGASGGWACPCVGQGVWWGLIPGGNAKDSYIRRFLKPCIQGNKQCQVYGQFWLGDHRCRYVQARVSDNSL